MGKNITSILDNKAFNKIFFFPLFKEQLTGEVWNSLVCVPLGDKGFALSSKRILLVLLII